MNNNQQANIYQFKITLIGIEPQIWRRIQVPEDYSFYDLHEAIQDAMGWDGLHLHQFEIKSPKTGNIEIISMNDGRNDLYSKLTTKDVLNTKISQYFTGNNRQAKYEYDFGDPWEHEIIFEKILTAEKGENYPKCIDGENACPPEDCGGVWGYEALLESLNNPKHQEYSLNKEWLSLDREFDPTEFDVNNVVFQNLKVVER